MKAFLTVLCFLMAAGLGAQDKPSDPGSAPGTGPGTPPGGQGQNPALPGQGPTAPKNQDYLLAFGLGFSGMDYLTTQNSVDPSQVSTTLQFNLASQGVNLFADITKYCTVRLGLRWGTTAGINASTSSTTNTASNLANDTLNGEWALEGKYPFFPIPQVSLAPKLGLAGLCYLSGTSFSGLYFSDASNRQMLSPVFLTFGLDLNAYLFDRLLIRVPVECGWGLNSRLPDYGTGTYSKSSLGVFRIGLEAGWML